MERPQKTKRLLFLHVDPRSPTTLGRTRSRSLDSKVRRHLMVDIGMSRRKPSKAPEFVTSVWSLAETSGSTPNTDRNDHSTSRHVDHLPVPPNDSAIPETTAQHSLKYTMAPTLHALSVFEKEWGEDWFSAYGFTLIMVAARNAMGSTCSTNTFWFPFAFRKSLFLRHYQQVFTSPSVLIPLYRRSARELRSLALERSLETIQCIESRISNPDASSATSDSVLSAVLALVCYNFTSLDFEQAMIHIKGMWIVVAARGGISTLQSNQDLMLMISWVDITAALLHDTKPLFPLSVSMANAGILRDSGLETLPVPLLGVFNSQNTRNIQFMNIISCVGDLNAIATHLRFELATKGDAIWDDEEHMGLLVNPITHRLLGQPRSSKPVTRWDTISEALRLGALIWIIRVKQRCRSYPGTAKAHTSTLLNMLASKSDVEGAWNGLDLRLVRLWLLVLCGISEPDDGDLAISLEMIASVMTVCRLVSWAEVVANIRQMPWVDIFEPLCAELGQRLIRDYMRPPVSNVLSGRCP